MLTKIKYGADRKMLIMLYRALVRSKIEYGCVVYEAASQSAKKMIDTIHHQAVRIITGAFRTSPICSMLADVDEMPLDLRRRILAMRYVIKLTQSNTHPAHQTFNDTHLRRIDNGTRAAARHPGVRVRAWFAEADISTDLVEPYDRCAVEPWVISEVRTNTDLLDMCKNLSPEVTCQIFMDFCAENFQNHIRFYTDGSKSDSGTGCAFVGDGVEKCFSLPHQASVFTSELYAIFRCLDQVSRTRARKFAIFTDSLSSLQALKTFYFYSLSSSYLLTLIRQKLHSLRDRGKTVDLVWLPSHCGISGNERADRSAKTATERAVPPGLRVPYFDLNALVKQYVAKLWQRRWEEDPKGAKLRGLKPRLGHWVSSSAGSRREEVVLSRLRMGHTHATHSFRLIRGDPPDCPRCGNLLSVKHVLVDCRDYEIERHRHLGGSPTLESLLGEFPTVELSSILSFLKSIDFNVVYSPT